MNTNAARLFRALSRDGLSVTRDGSIYAVRTTVDPDGPAAEILLPDSLPLEAKSVRQLAALASARHPDGGRVCRACATPDFHPGDGGIAIGSVVASSELVIPQAVGTDINCGMRLHVADLSVDTFLSRRDDFVDRMKGDYFFGTRDVVFGAATMRGLFRDGLLGWLLAFRQDRMGRIAASDLDQIEAEVNRVYLGGSLTGDPDEWAPRHLVPADGRVRDAGLATVGRGNHFVEVQTVEEVVDRREAYRLGVKVGQLAFMVHSGSRGVGHHVGGYWAEQVRQAWPAGAKHPPSGIFPLSWATCPDLCAAYLTGEATAANYGFVNRMLLAELLRLRLREVYGDHVEAPLVYDLPHNVTLRENGLVVTRKGACPAHAGQPVIIPGSMGASSFLCVGTGADRFLASASHGAGRSASRQDAAHRPRAALGLDGVDCVTLRDERRLEEAPAMYKPIAPVIDAQVAAGTLAVVARMRPVLTFKA